LERSARRVEPAILVMILTESWALVEWFHGSLALPRWSYVIGIVIAAELSSGFIDPVTVATGIVRWRARHWLVPRVCVAHGANIAVPARDARIIVILSAGGEPDLSRIAIPACSAWGIRVHGGQSLVHIRPP